MCDVDRNLQAHRIESTVADLGDSHAATFIGGPDPVVATHVERPAILAEEWRNIVRILTHRLPWKFAPLGSGTTPSVELNLSPAIDGNRLEASDASSRHGFGIECTTLIRLTPTAHRPGAEAPQKFSKP